MTDDTLRVERFAPPVQVRPSATPDEAVAIVAALEALNGEQEDSASLRRSRWRLAGLLGHQVEPGMKLEGSLWSYSKREGIA
jgi:predicted DNA-binding transcriptional regulator YafY